MKTRELVLSQSPDGTGPSINTRELDAATAQTLPEAALTPWAFGLSFDPDGRESKGLAEGLSEWSLTPSPAVRALFVVARPSSSDILLYGAAWTGDESARWESGLAYTAVSDGEVIHPTAMMWKKNSLPIAEVIMDEWLPSPPDYPNLVIPQHALRIFPAKENPVSWRGALDYTVTQFSSTQEASELVARIENAVSDMFTNAQSWGGQPAPAGYWGGATLNSDASNNNDVSETKAVTHVTYICQPMLMPWYYPPYYYILWVPIGQAPICKEIGYAQAFLAVADGPWPLDQPVWSGTAGATGSGESRTIQFNSTGIKTLTADCNASCTVTYYIYDMSLNSVDITANIIQTTLQGPNSDVPDTISLQLYNETTQMASPLEPNGNSSYTDCTAGSHWFEFDRTNPENYEQLPVGDFTHLRAVWSIYNGNPTITRTFPYRIRNFGKQVMTQHNIPYESDSTCQSGDPDPVCFCTDTRTEGEWSTGTLPHVFAQQAQRNASGVSLNHGNLQVERLYRSAHGSCNTAYHFRQNLADGILGTGSCGDQLSDTSVAVHDTVMDHELSSGDHLYIRAQDIIKEVQDEGNWNAGTNNANKWWLDNFTSSHACTGIPSLDDSVYIKLFY